CTPPVRSTSASCSAAWSSPASASRRARTSRASSTTSTWTATSCSPLIPGRALPSRTAFSSPRPEQGSVSGERRIVILAEGFSGDPHHGKTSRGVLRYRPEQVVAILDSDRAGESQEGFPIVGTVDEALAYGPTTALVGVATTGGRFPPAWRDLLKACIAAGLDVENGLHEF